jgi:hypothetical protein
VNRVYAAGFNLSLDCTQRALRRFTYDLTTDAGSAKRNPDFFIDPSPASRNRVSLRDCSMQI